MIPDLINIASADNRFRGDNEILAYEKINAAILALAAMIETNTLEFATKSSSVDAGELKQMAFDDDWLYICVEAGEAGEATWKKIAMAITD